MQKTRITTPAIEKYVPIIAQAENFQIQGVWERAEQAANGSDPIEGLSKHDAAVLAKYCWDELIERNAQEIINAVKKGA